MPQIDAAQKSQIRLDRRFLSTVFTELEFPGLGVRLRQARAKVRGSNPKQKNVDQNSILQDEGVKELLLRAPDAQKWLTLDPAVADSHIPPDELNEFYVWFKRRQEAKKLRRRPHAAAGTQSVEPALGIAN